MSNPKKSIAVLLLSFLCFMGVCVLSYRHDNKYTAPGPQPINGVMICDSSVPDPVWLINGWQYYGGRLLAPEDFDGAPVLPDRYISIGQIMGMEAGRPDSPPHGSATYRLTLSLPETVSSYTLELPEIYSAYRLYIGDRLAAFRGNPEKGAYIPALRSGSVTFEAAGTVTILLAVSDWSHLYSGLVYPPAFGTPDAVASTLDARFSWALAVTVLALFFGVFHMGLAVILKSRRSLLSGLICLSFGGAVCSPVVHRLMTTAVVPFYPLEIFCRYAIYGFAVLLVTDLCGRKGWLPTVFSVFVLGFACLTPAIALAAPHLSYRTMAAFSRAAGIYKAVCSLWMLGMVLADGMWGQSAECGSENGDARFECSVSPFGRTDTMTERSARPAHHLILLAGVCIFSSSLAADRLLSSFEPIRFGWFSELAGFFFVLILSFLLLKDSAGLYRLRTVLTQEKLQMEGIIGMQKKHYTELAGQMQEIRRMRHDVRHHFTQLGGLIDNGDLNEAAKYLARLSNTTLSQAPLSFCEAYYMDVILRYYYAKAEESGVPMIINTDVPAHMDIPEEDLCVILGNLLDNALEAVLEVPAGRRLFTVTMTCVNSALALEVQNSGTGDLIPDGSLYRSTRGGGLHGTGLASVKAIVEKQEGNIWIRTTPGENGVYRFTVQILVPVNGHGGVSEQ